MPLQFRLPPFHEDRPHQGGGGVPEAEIGHLLRRHLGGGNESGQGFRIAQGNLN